MELINWKNIERESENAIEGARVQIEVSEILLRHAKKQIKALGGMTSEEENAKAKEERNPAFQVG